MMEITEHCRRQRRRGYTKEYGKAMKPRRRERVGAPEGMKARLSKRIERKLLENGCITKKKEKRKKENNKEYFKKKSTAMKKGI